MTQKKLIESMYNRVRAVDKHAASDVEATLVSYFSITGNKKAEPYFLVFPSGDTFIRYLTSTELGNLPEGVRYTPFPPEFLEENPIPEEEVELMAKGCKKRLLDWGYDIMQGSLSIGSSWVQLSMGDGDTSPYFHGKNDSDAIFKAFVYAYQKKDEQ